VGDCPCTPIASITVFAVEFTSDHHVLKDHNENWDDGGNLYPKPDWNTRRQTAVSHTMDEEVALKLMLDVQPLDACPETGTIRGVGPDGLVFEKAGVAFKGGWITVPLKSEKKLARKIQELDFAISWTSTGTSVALSATTHNTMFVTMGTPTDPRHPGITLRRMRRAVSDTGSANSLDPHEIVEHVMSTWDKFNLHVRMKNAWELANEARDSSGHLVGADCQTIVRYTEAVIKMVGCPGTAQAVVIWAKPSAPTLAIENDYGGHSLNDPNITHPKHPTWIATLVDGDGGGNAFEACLKFTYNSKTIYYAGGVGPKKNKDEVLHVFVRMSWFEDHPGGAAVEKATIHTYH
jgi:hypothetical protein